jgi:cytochrome c oxidase subunit II
MAFNFIVQTITQGYYCIISHLNTEEEKDKKRFISADNNKLEFIWSSIPAIVLAVLILYGLYAWTNIMFVMKKMKDAYCY